MCVNIFCSSRVFTWISIIGAAHMCKLVQVNEIYSENHTLSCTQFYSDALHERFHFKLKLINNFQCDCDDSRKIGWRKKVQAKQRRVVESLQSV